MRWPDPLPGARLPARPAAAGSARRRQGRPAHPARALVLAGLLAAPWVVPARAQQALVPGPIIISDGRVVAGPQGGASTAVMTISNNGALPEHLQAALCPAAAAVTLQPPPGTPADQARAGLLLPPGATQTLDPSGWHLALSDLRTALTAGEVVACSVRLGGSGEQVVELTVVPPR